ncbi:hypothetical protein PN462_01155 [Spirulina sp. CS-785/01]|uniref:tetratricopeptide repeat protein n=1 Tax=Spirulina sp. CS-785/01 TaxID=3021716 RepID=UPI00232E05E2|nr:hypothetical protein [Spirulina sp. CS-785/01]MDB9311691.1 hypothetical protein [Spirulina sp. CS-785/01]
MLTPWLTAAFLSVSPLPTLASPPAGVVSQVAQNPSSPSDTMAIWEQAALGLTATTLAQLGEVEEGLEMARSLNNPNIQTDVLSQISRILVEQGDPEQALDLLNTMPDGDLGSRLWNLALELADQEQWTAISQLSEAVDDPQFRWDMVQILAETGATERALDLYNELPEPSPTVRVGQLAITLAQQDQFEPALDLAQSLDPSLEKALILSGIAQIQAEAGQDADLLFQEAIDLTERLDPSIQRTSVFGQIALRLAKIGNFDQALALREKLPNQGNNSEMPYYFAYYLAEAGQFDQALEFAQVLENNPTLYNSLMGELAIFFTEAGEVEQALALVDTLASPDYGKGRIAVTLAEQGEIEAAVDLAQTLPLPPQREILSQIAQRVADNGDHERAESLFLEALATIPAENTGGEATLHIAQQMLYAGFTERAIAFLDQLQTPELRAELLRELVAQLSDNEDYTRALSLLANEENSDQKTAGLSILAFSLSQQDNPQLTQVLEEAQTLTNPHQQAVIYSTAAYQLALNNKPQQARELIDWVIGNW